MCHFHKPCSCLYPTQLSPPTEYLRPRHGHGRNYVVCKNCAEKKTRQTKDFFPSLSLSRDKRGETISRHLLTVLPRFFPREFSAAVGCFFFSRRRFSPSPSSVFFLFAPPFAFVMCLRARGSRKQRTLTKGTLKNLFIFKKCLKNNK